MESTQNPEQAGARDARADEKLPSDYEKIVREELARVQERLAKLAPAGEPGSLEPMIAAFRPAPANDIKIAPDDRPAPKAGAVRGVMGFAMAVCIAGGAVVWQSSYGEEAKQMIAAWVPQLGSTSSPQTEQTGPPAQQVAAADTAAPQPPPAAEAAPPDAAPPDAAPPDAAAPAASAPPDFSESLQTMTRDIAGLQQAIEKLKAGQDQMVRDNARVAEQLRANQEQITRLLAKASEQNLHARTPQRPIAAPMRRSVATLPPPPQPMPPPPQAAPPPQLAAQPQAEAADLPPAPRPPKPVP
jgi:hypothetical protein